MKTINYYQPVIIPIAKNGSERLGVNAVTKIWDAEKPDLKMELTVFASNHTLALERLQFHLSGEKPIIETVELPCEYYLCSSEVVKKFKPFHVSKPFLDYIDEDDDSNECFVAWLNFAEVEKYYNEHEAEIDELMINFWLRECVPGTMDVSNISMRQAKKGGLFREIEEKLSITVERNRAMTICNLAQRFNCTPVQLIDKYL